MFYLVPIRQVEPEIKYYIIKISISTWILSGLYKAVVDLQIVKVKVHLLFSTERFSNSLILNTIFHSGPSKDIEAPPFPVTYHVYSSFIFSTTRFSIYYTFSSIACDSGSEN